MANELIRGKQSFNLIEIRFIRLVIAQILIEDQQAYSYITTVSEFADFFCIDSSNIYRDIREFTKNFEKKKVLVLSSTTEKTWMPIEWFKSVEYRGNGKLIFTLSDKIVPYILGLREKFTKCPLKYLVLLHSVYAIRLYELILMEKNEKHRNEVRLSLSFLREILLYKDNTKEEREMYSKFGLFRAKVIEPAIAEINKCTDITVECEFIKTGRAVTDIVFKVRNKEQLKKISERKEHIVQKVDDTAMEIPYSIKSILPLREEDIIEIMYAANGNCELVEEKYQLAQRQRKISNLTGWMIKAIKEDYKMIETVERAKQNQFNDFPQREYSKEEFAEIERKLLNIDYTSELQRKSRRRSL